MKLRFEVDQAECFRRGIDCPKSIVDLEVSPAEIPQEDRNLIADRLSGIEVKKYPVKEYKGYGLILANEPTFEALIEAIKVTEREMTENSIPKEKKAILEEKADILTGRANIEKAIKQTVETIVSHKVGPTGLNRAKKTLRQTVAAFKEAVKE